VNPRLVEVILRNRATGALYSAGFDRGRGNRLWLPGPGQTATLDLAAGLPANLPEGGYEALLHLPDPSPRLYGRPEFSIRLANRDVWEPGTGFNRLLATVQITSGPATLSKPDLPRYAPHAERQPKPAGDAK
jgi:hypothetical protein